MSSSELIIRRGQSAYASDAAYTNDGVAEVLPLPYFDPNGAGSPSGGAGTVIRGRRFGLGSAAVMARSGVGSPESEHRSGSPSAGQGPGVPARTAWPVPGTVGSALLQVELHELRQRIEDRAYAAGRARAETELAAAIE